MGREINKVILFISHSLHLLYVTLFLETWNNSRENGIFEISSGHSYLSINSNTAIRFDVIIQDVLRSFFQV